MAPRRRRDVTVNRNKIEERKSQEICLGCRGDCGDAKCLEKHLQSIDLTTTAKSINNSNANEVPVRPSPSYQEALKSVSESTLRRISHDESMSDTDSEHNVLTHDVSTELYVLKHFPLNAK